MSFIVDYPVSFQAVDIACFSKCGNKIYLGRKPKRDKYQFIGGFVDPKDTNLEQAAQRELSEEFPSATPDICTLPEYIASFRINDERYINSPHKIMSALFYIELTKNNVPLIAGDDITEIRLFDISEARQYFRENHLPLFDALY